MSVSSVKSIKKKKEEKRSRTIGWWSGRGGPSGGDHLDVVGRVEAHLAAAQLSFAPALLVLLAQLQQLLACRGRQSQSLLIQTTMQIKGLGCFSVATF